MKKMKPGVILPLFHLLLHFTISGKGCLILQQRQRWHKYAEVKEKFFQELNAVLWSEDFQLFSYTDKADGAFYLHLW